MMDGFGSLALGSFTKTAISYAKVTSLWGKMIGFSNQE
jgi:hypothetical protein